MMDGKRMNEWPHWPDARGWIGFGSYALTIMVLWMIARDQSLRTDEFFKVLATLIVGGFVKDVLGWAYQATKTGGELAEHNAKTVAALTPDPALPNKVEVVNTPQNPANVTDAHDSDDGALPESEQIK